MPTHSTNSNTKKQDQEAAPTSTFIENLLWIGESGILPYSYAGQALQQVDNGLNSLGEAIYNHSPESVQDLIMAAKPYFPNKKEVFLASAPTVLVEMIGETWLNLGNDILSKEVFRDFAKIFGIGASMMTDTSYGGTDYKYDEANVYAQIFKTVCKAGFIGGSFASGGPAAAASVAPWANMACEVPSRAMILLGRKQQDEGLTDVPFFEYAIDNLSLELFASSVSSTIVKKGVSTVIGKVAKPLNIHGKSIKLATDVIEKPLSLAAEVDLNPFTQEKHIDSAYETLVKVYEASPVLSPVTVPLAAHVEAGARIAGSMVYSYIATPGSRFGQEITSYATKLYYQEGSANKKNQTEVKSDKEEKSESSAANLDDALGNMIAEEAVKMHSRGTSTDTTLGQKTVEIDAQGNVVAATVEVVGEAMQPAEEIAA